MLSDEEKKAIVYLKSYCINDVLYDNKHYEQIEILLNLIEKQQKEIEELKKDKLELINKNHVVHLKDVEKELREMKKVIDTKNAEIECLNVIHESYKENNFISKDKIKAKIEEIKNDCRKCRFKEEICEELNQNNQCVQGECIKVLQSLLEKE